MLLHMFVLIILPMRSISACDMPQSTVNNRHQQTRFDWSTDSLGL